MPSRRNRPRRRRAAAQDPTRSGGLRARYRRALRSRWARVRRGVREAIRARDVFGIQRLVELPPERAFAEGTESNRITRFVEWLTTYAREILDAGGRWQRELVQTFWQHGERLAQRAVVSAAQRSRRRTRDLPPANAAPGTLPAPPMPVPAGPVLPGVGAPIPERLETLILRNQQRVGTILDAVAAEVSEALGQTLLGRPNEALPAIERAITRVGVARSDILAHTGVVEAVNEGTLHALERLGVETVSAEIEVQFTTAGDARVCAQCRGLVGVYTVANARGRIPVHPRCRCHWTVVAQPAQRQRRVAAAA